MSETLLLHYALNSIWQVPLLALSAVVCERLVRPSMAWRHGLWIATLLCAVALPLRGALPQAAFPPSTVLQRSMGTLPASDADEPVAMESLRTPLPRQTITLGPRTVHGIVALYCLALFAGIVRLLLAADALRNLARQSVRAQLTDAEREVAQRLATYFGRRFPAIRRLPDAAMSPFATGILRPAIFLPAASPRLPLADFAAIVAHELAHMQRQDLAVNLLLRIVTLPVAYHPGTALIERHVRHTRELLCDRLAATALAAETGCDAAIYAGSLVAMAQRVRAYPSSEAAALLARSQPTHAHANSKIKSQSHLEERIMQLIEPQPSSRPFARLALGVAILLSAVAGTACVHLAPAVFAAEMPARAPVVRAPDKAVDSVQTTPSSPSMPIPSPAATNAPRTPVTKHSTGHHDETIVMTPTDLTPQDREQLAQEMEAIHQEILNETKELREPAFQEQLKASLPKPEELQQQVADALRLSVGSPEFKLRMDAIQKSTANLRLQMPVLTLKLAPLDSPAFKAEMERLRLHAERLSKRSAEMQHAMQLRPGTLAQLDHAAASIAEARKHVSDEDALKSLDEAQSSIDQARQQHVMILP